MAAGHGEGPVTWSREPRLIRAQVHKQHFLGEAWLERRWGGELHRVLPLVQFRLQMEDKDAASLVTLGNWKCVRVRPGSSRWVWRAELNQTQRKFLGDMSRCKAPTTWGCCLASDPMTPLKNYQSEDSPESQWGHFILSQISVVSWTSL